MDNEGLSFEQITEILDQNEKEKNKDRRQRKDIITRLATILSLLAWAIMIAVWVVLEFASPDRGMMFTQTFFQWHFGTDATGAIRTRWDRQLVYLAYVLMLVSFGTCFFAFLLNRMRMKRKTDKYKKSIFVIAGITLIAFIAFLIRFGSMLF
jgi:fatty acid desaturase